MKNSESTLIPIPTELLEEIGYTKDAVLEFYTENGKIVMGICPEEDVRDCLGAEAYQQMICNHYENCYDCPACCPDCGGCMLD